MILLPNRERRYPFLNGFQLHWRGVLSFNRLRAIVAEVGDVRCERGVCVVGFHLLKCHTFP
jgi:hypothetical protein